MEVAIGLPSTLPGTTGTELVEWAQRADRAGFSSLGTIDRIIYPNYDPLVALSAAAAVTERIRLATTILIVPYRENAVVLAKQAASLNELSDGRLVLGVAVGGRDDDFEIAGVPFGERGRRMDAMLPRMKEIWAGDAVGPNGAPRLMVGGHSDPAFRRAAEHSDGWIFAGGPTELFAQGRAAVKTAWEEAGREGEPHVMALAYFGLGPHGRENAEREMGRYYAFLGEYAAQVAAGAATDAQTVEAYLAGFEEAGCDELVFFPTSPNAEQVDLLAEAAL